MNKDNSSPFQKTTNNRYSYLDQLFENYSKLVPEHSLYFCITSKVCISDKTFFKKKKKYKLSQFQAICLTPFSSDELPFNIDRV